MLVWPELIRHWYAQVAYEGQLAYAVGELLRDCNELQARRAAAAVSFAVLSAGIERFWRVLRSGLLDTALAATGEAT